tara:strand:+ start:1269 stop:1466 length:198 start_codon:yes stop_codon:yes gene_type:complete
MISDSKLISLFSVDHHTQQPDPSTLVIVFACGSFNLPHMQQFPSDGRFTTIKVIDSKGRTGSAKL